MKKLILAILIFFVNTFTVFATELPPNVVSKLKKDISGVMIRFDGLIEYPDGTQYLPVLPMDLKSSDSDAKIVLTFPDKQNLNDKPALVLFDNNFAMLKIIKATNHNPTVLFYNSMPLCVKRGIFPQDLLVPENLVIPEELQVLLGNLSIPVAKLEDEFDYFQDLDRFLEPEKAQQVKRQNPLPSPVAFDKNFSCLANKMMYAINYQANVVYLLDSETGKVKKVIPLRSTPSNFLMTRSQRYLLVTMLGTPKLAVIDLETNSVVKEIDSGLLPTAIAVDKTKNIAYIANQNSSTISLVDLDNMDLLDKKDVQGTPSKITLSEDGKTLLYFDGAGETLYKITFGEDIDETELLFKTKNLSKALLINNNIYIANRDKNYVTVVNTNSKKPICQIPVGEKPLDMYAANTKLYVVNAESDSLSVIDLKTNQKIKDISLGTKGFPSKINILEPSSRALITTASNHEYVLVDLNKDVLLKKFPIDPIVSSVIVSRKH